MVDHRQLLPNDTKITEKSLLETATISLSSKVKPWTYSPNEGPVSIRHCLENLCKPTDLKGNPGETGLTTCAKNCSNIFKYVNTCKHSIDIECVF